MAARWARAAAVVRGPDLTEIDERRRGPGGREHFADPRPGDFPRLSGAGARTGGLHMTDEHAGSYRAYLEAQAAANAARGSTEPTLRNTPAPGTPEGDRVAALDAAAAAAWDRHCAAVLGAAKPAAEPELEAG